MGMKDLIPERIQKKHITVGTVVTGMLFLGAAYAWGDKVGVHLPRVAMENQVIQVAGDLDTYSQIIQKRIDNLDDDLRKSELRRLRAERNEINLRIRKAENAGELPDTADLLRLDQIEQEMEDLD